jgi:triacylglycerol lipase
MALHFPLGTRRSLTLFAALVAAASCVASTAWAAPHVNNHPIVLVHDFLGWGRDEMAGFHYWGGVIDIQEDLKSQGYSVFTAAVGPVSSNWDQACELYAQLKGGTVDYGVVHSTRHGHARFGRKYTALYPNWGTKTGTDVARLHIVGHGSGGVTARVLVFLLENGKPEEQTGSKNLKQAVNPLFAGGHKGWVRSVTTLASPHDGTTLATGVGQFLPFIKNVMSFFSSLAGTGHGPVYDFKLDQWGLQRNPNETLDAYTSRVLSSSIWVNNHDISIWSMSPDGAKETNTLHGAAVPDVYYISWTTEDTYQPFFFSSSRYPLPDMFPVLWPYSTFMGSYIRTSTGGVVEINSSWFKNDGVVNSRSMAGPSIGATIRSYATSHALGVGIFNDMGVKQSWDHYDITGLSTDPLKYLTSDLAKFYTSLASTVASLPK